MQQIDLEFLLIQITFCLIAIQVCVFIFDKLNAPKVFGEIFAGIVLGPSCFGFFYPSWFQKIFVSNVVSVFAFKGLQELGLLLLMFCSGLEIQLLIKGRDRVTCVFSGLLGVVIPFGFALVFYNYINPTKIAGVNGADEGLKYFFAIACSITSIPVISRIFMDLQLMQTSFANLCISIAIIEDLVLYAFMAIFIPSKNSSKFMASVTEGHEILNHMISTISLVFIAYKIAPHILMRAKKIKLIQTIFKNYLTLSFIILTLFTVFSVWLGVPSFLGAFLAGIILGRTPFQKSEYFEHIKEFSFSTLIPIFFFGIGIKLDLIKSFNLAFFLIFLFLSSFIKVSGVTVASYFFKNSFKNSLNFGIALNARGGPGIVLASLGLSLGLINESFFVSLILTALITSWFAGHWLSTHRAEIKSYTSG